MTSECGTALSLVERAVKAWTELEHSGPGATRTEEDELGLTDQTLTGQVESDAWPGDVQPATPEAATSRRAGWGRDSGADPSAVSQERESEAGTV
jgi:hypothetical protein